MRLPKYRRHPNGQAFVQHRSIATPNHRKYLGKFGSEESQQRYKAFIAELAAVQAVIPVRRQAEITILELIAHYRQFAKGYYGESKERVEMDLALRPVAALYGGTRVCEFGPKALKAVQQHMIGLDLSRGVINHRVNRIRRVFRWAVSEQLVPGSQLQELEAVEPLRRGFTQARETEPVGPVDPATIRTTIKHLSPTVAAMVQVQWICGMRPIEVEIMRPENVDTSGPVWLYTPSTHKNEWRGKGLVKAIPRAAQSILGPFLDRDPATYCFVPAESDLWWRQNRRSVEERKHPIYPCELRRREREGRRRKPRKGCTPRYSTDAYRRAIHRAIEKAGKSGEPVPVWAPNQLRHAVATMLRDRLGIEKTQAWLGHSDPDTTAIYTERQISELIAIAAEVDRLFAA